MKLTTLGLILYLFLSSYVINAQDQVIEILDSLTLVKSHTEKARLSSKVAWELKDIDWERTVHYLEYSEEQAIASNSNETLATYYSAAADIYYDKYVLDVALDYFQKAYTIYSQTENQKEKFFLENSLAIIYARMNNLDKALFYFKKAYLYQAEQKDSIYLAQILNNIGTLYIEKDADSSEAYYLKSLKIANKLNNIEMFAYLYTNLGRILYIKGDKQEAQSYFEKALSLPKTELNDEIRKMIFQIISSYYLEDKQNDSAIFYAKKSIETSNEDTFSFRNQDAIRTLYKAYIVEGDYKNAVKYFELYDNIRDSFNIEEKAVNIERLKLELEYRTKDQIRALQQKKSEFGYIIFGLSLVLIVLILIIILLRYRTKISKMELEKELVEAKRKELNATLEMKNNVLIAKAMTEIHRTEIIQSILENLNDIKIKAVKKETQNAIDYISKLLEKDININIWKEFELSFEQVHESFYHSLNNKHPELTSSDRRLCALLKLNLTSKEISQITGQSFKSVENARTRLRKKLNLTNTKIELVVYLNSLN